MRPSTPKAPTASLPSLRLRLLLPGGANQFPGRELHPLKSSAFHGALLRQLSARMARQEVSYGCETPWHSDSGMALYHRWLWFCAPAHSRDLPRDHARIRRCPFTSPRDRLRLPAIFCSCRLPVHRRTEGTIDRERQPSTTSAVRMGADVTGRGVPLRFRG